MTELVKYLMEKNPSVVKDFLPDARGWTNRFPIKSSSSDNIYNIAQRISDGTWGCSCRGWIRWGKCRHLNTLMPLIEQAEAAMGIKKRIQTPTPQKVVAQISQPKPVQQAPQNVNNQTGIVKHSFKAPVIPNNGKKTLGVKNLTPNPNTGIVIHGSTAVGKVKAKKPWGPVYKKYDTSKGFGSPEQWRAAFEERLNFKTVTDFEIKEVKAQGLCDTMIAAKDYTELRNAYYTLIKQYHPDTMGDTEDNRTKAQVLNDTFFELKQKFKK